MAPNDRWYRPSPARRAAGAPAPLPCDMTSGCPRAAELAGLAALLLRCVACDAEADAGMRARACELIELLERERPAGAVPHARFAPAAARLAGRAPEKDAA